jgi:hypothetical protein
MKTMFGLLFYLLLLPLVFAHEHTNDVPETELLALSGAASDLVPAVERRRAQYAAK